MAICRNTKDRRTMICPSDSHDTLHGAAAGYLAAGLCALPAIRAEKRPDGGQGAEAGCQVPLCGIGDGQLITHAAPVPPLIRGCAENARTSATPVGGLGTARADHRSAGCRTRVPAERDPRGAPPRSLSLRPGRARRGPGCHRSIAFCSRFLSWLPTSNRRPSERHGFVVHVVVNR